jgi:uncharacterized membrane protein YfcA
MPLALVGTILLFVIANKVTDGRCWAVTKKVLKWGLVVLCAVIIIGVALSHWGEFQRPLTELGAALLGILGPLLVLLAVWAFFDMVKYRVVLRTPEDSKLVALFEKVKHGIVRPLQKGPRGR